MRQDPADRRVRRPGGAGRRGAVLAARCHDGETALPFVLAADLLRPRWRVRPGAAARAARPRPPPWPGGWSRRWPPRSRTRPRRRWTARSPSPGCTRRSPTPAGRGTRMRARPAGSGLRVPSRGHRGGGRALGRQLLARPAGLPGAAAGRLAAAARAELAAGAGRAAAGAADRADRGRRASRSARPSSRARSGAEAIAALLGRGRDAAAVDVARLLAETRGLPMLVREYIEALRARPGAGGPGGEQATGGRRPASGTCCAPGCRRSASRPGRC